MSIITLSRTEVSQIRLLLCIILVIILMYGFELCPKRKTDVFLIAVLFIICFINVVSCEGLIVLLDPMILIIIEQN